MNKESGFEPSQDGHDRIHELRIMENALQIDKHQYKIDMSALKEAAIPKRNYLFDLKTKNQLDRNVRLSNDINLKIKDLKFKRYPEIGLHLSDIVISLEVINDLVNNFLEINNEDSVSLGDSLIKLEMEISHMNRHAKSLKRPLGRLINYCYNL